MNDPRSGLSPLTDISANMFAAFILFLVMAAAILAQKAPARQSGPPSRDLRFVVRPALDAGAMVEMLYDRRPGASGVSLDLAKDRLSVTSSRGRLDLTRAAALRGSLSVRALAPADGAPVRIYVFSNDLYDPVVKSLNRAGLRFEELSVPIALRSADGAGWSGDFANLLAKARDLSGFRRGLARLLNGGEGARASGRAAGGFENRADDDLIARVRAIWRAVSSSLEIGCAAAAVAWIEIRSRREWRRRRRPG